MRSVSASVVAVLASTASLTGCARYSEPAAPPPGYANPGQWSPLPAPGAAPAQPYGYGQPYAYGGQPYPQQPYAQPGYAPAPQAYPQPQGGALPFGQGDYTQVLRPVNVPALMAMQGRIPCAPREVAPGSWATFDCGPFEAMNQVLKYVPMVRFDFLPTGPLPASVDHRTEGGEGPVREQGAVGVCTAMSLAGAMDNAIRRMGRSDTVSALHIWSRYGVGVTGKAGDSNVGKSVALESTWGYDAAKACKLSRSPMDTCATAYGVSSASESYDPDLRAEHARADSSGRYKLAAVEQLQAKPANPTQIAGVLAGGDDVWMSFSVNDQAWTSRALHDGVIPDYDTVEDTGHAVVLAGYRTIADGSKQFLVHNSWGVRWGVGGYGWISEAMVTKYARSAYRVRVTDGGGGGGGSLPAPASNAGDCPAGQTKAPFLGTCIPVGVPSVPGLPGVTPPPAPAPSAPKPPASACPGGAPSFAGVCLPIPR